MRTHTSTYGGRMTVTLLFCLGVSLPLHAQNSGTGSGRGTVESDPQNFYAAGKLQRVRRKDNGAERMALTDGAGAITAFLAPTARWDFRQYVGREIAIRGQVLNADDDNAPYVSVERITEIAVGGASQLRGGRRTIGTVSFDEEIPPGQLSQVPGTVVGPQMGSAWAPVEGEIVMDGNSMSGLQPQPYMSGLQGAMTTTPPGSCPTCGGDCQGVCEAPACDTCPQPCTVDFCGPPGWLWLRGEYLAWWADGMDLPPLVTTGSAVDPGTAGVLGEAGTTILYGNNPALESGRSGYRLDFGGWFGPRRCFGWEGEFLEVGTITDHFQATSDANGNPVLARPFVNVNPRDPDTGDPLPGPINDAQLVGFPGILAGTVAVDSSSLLRSAAGRLRWNICCRECARPRSACGPCSVLGCNGPCGYPPFMKVDFTAGYRYGNLNESLVITEDLTSLDPEDPSLFDIYDSFETRNDFHGGEFGTVFESGINRWTLEMLMRIAVGNVQQKVAIDGGTTIATFGTPAQTFPGGLLAQTSNIGTYESNQFAVMPELATNVGLYLSPRLRWTVGYTFVYISNVVRPGDQIDLDVNPDIIPPPVDDPGGLGRPEFVFRTTDFWAQGINTGLDFRW